MSPFLALSHVFFELPNGQLLLGDISFSLNKQRTALVGPTGVGKTVLAKIAAGMLKPTSGEIKSKGRVSYIPQYWEGSEKDTVAKVLGLELVIQAIQSINSGSGDAEDYERAESWWDWASQLENCYHLIHKERSFKLNFELGRAIGSYSGGEQFWILWLAAMLAKPDLLIMDEPSNHLDETGRKGLYEWLKKADKTVLIVSHDRQLLEQVQHIIEISPQGLFHHPGNYQQYRHNHLQRLEQKQLGLISARRDLNKKAGEQQKAYEKQQQRVAQGKSKAVKNSWSRLEIGSAKNSASASLEANRRSQDARLRFSRQELGKVTKQQEWINPISFTLPNSVMPVSRKVCTLSSVKNGIPEPLHPPIDIELKGPQRVHLSGDNGAGKSLLLQALLATHKPDFGKADIHVPYALLDQHCKMLHPQQSSLENFRRLSPDYSEKDCRDRLAWIGLRAEKADICTGSLSGGERLKAAIACTLLNSITPQLLLLDEPSNHLDLESILALERALEQFGGAIILVSHDQFLLRNLKMTHQLNISTGKLRIFPE